MVAGDQGASGLPLHFKVELEQIGEALLKGPLMRLRVAKEHVPSL
jgi:hypothetical protein